MALSLTLSVNEEQDCTDIPAEVIRERLHQFYESIVKSLNTSELNILLVQQGLLTAQEVYKCGNCNCTELVMKKTEGMGLDGYSQLYSCICKEAKHMGHRYIQSILENQEYASQEAMKHSMTMKGKLVSSLSVLVTCDLKELLIHMYSKNLLTLQEWVKLNVQTQNERNELLINIVAILDTKGPLAYSIFGECLQTIDCRVYAQIFKSEMNEPRKPQKRRLEQAVVQASPNKKLPPNIKLYGCLRGRRYNDIMKIFQQCHHNGEWVKLEAEVKELMAPGTPTELQVVANLECAISWVFRKDSVRSCGKGKAAITT